MKKFIIGMTAMALMTSALGTNVFADGSRVIKVDKLQTVGTLEEQKGSMIEIKESEKDAWEENTKFEFKLPSTVKWNSKTVINGDYKPEIDGSVMRFNLKTNTKQKDVVYIIPYFDIERGTQKGDLSVLVSGGAKDDKDETFAVAKISDYAMNLSSSLERVQKNTKSIPVELILNESVENSMLPNIPYAITFDNAKVDSKSIKISQQRGKDKLTTGDVKDNYAEFTMSENSSEKNKWVITMNIMPNKDYVGDITANFEGRSMETVSTVVAKVYESGSFEEREADKVELGKKDQSLKDISFVESMASGLAQGDYIFKIDPEYKGLSFVSSSLNVMDGNIRVSTTRENDSMIKFSVKGASTEPSKLTLSDLKVTMDQYGYDGLYKLELVNEKTPNDVIASIDLFKVNPKDNKVEDPKQPVDNKDEMKDGIYFVIGQKEYTVINDGKKEQKTLDVAPYIAKGNRTMLPLRATAETLNMEVEWNAKARTATLKSKDDDMSKIIVLTIGDKTMLVDGKKVELDSAPEVKDSRTFLPVAQIANALDVKTAWEKETKTVTLSK